MSINGINLNDPNYSAARNFSPLTEEQLEERRINREVMGRLNMSDSEAQLSMGQARRRFTDAHVAQNGLTARPAAFHPNSPERQTQILSILEELRNTTEEGSVRMSLIDRMMAEISAGSRPAEGQFA